MTTLAAGATDGLERTRRIGKAISDTGRLRILSALRRSELCVCHLVDLLELDASTVSRHVAILRDAGLIETRKEGRWLHCRRSKSRAALFRFLDASLDGAPEIRNDELRIQSDCC